MVGGGLLVSVTVNMWTGSGCFSVQSQIRQQEEVEKKEEVAVEMSDLVVYCQPRSKEKDRFGKHMQTLYTKTCERKQHDDGLTMVEKLHLSGNILQHKQSLLSVLSFRGG